MPDRVRPRAAGPRPRTALGAVLWMTIGVAFAYVVWTAGVLALSPALAARSQTDPLTGLVSLVADLTARLSGLTTLGLLFGIVLITPRGRDDEVGEVGRRLAAWAGRSAQVWFAAAFTMTVANSAWVNGVPMGYTLRPDAWWTFQSSTPGGLAWTFAALVAAVTAAVAYRARRLAPFALAWIAGLAAAVFVAVTGNVSVGHDHDWATDAAVAVALAMVPLASGALGIAASWLAGAGSSLLPAVQRYHRAVVPLVALAVAGHAVIAWQELAGRSPVEVFFGVPTLGIFGVTAFLLGSWAWRQLAGHARPDSDPVRASASVARDLVGFIAYAAFLAAANHVPPPRFLVPQTIQVNYLGYEMDVPATLERLAGFGRPNLLWLLLCGVAIVGYGWGMVRVRRAGGTWPVPRLLAWLAGWLLMLYLAVSGLWEYSTAAFSWHMLVHMTVNMLIPTLCVLGAPFTLAEAAARPRDDGEAAGPRELLAALARNRLVRWLLSPPVLWIVYVSSLYVVYFSPIFPWLMRYHWAHQLMLLHFLVAGYAFFSLVVGLDRQVWRLPHLVKFALLLSIMPFHAIFAVGIMMSASLIGADFYQTIAVTWVGDLMADQNVAGQITWFTGEVPMFIAVIALAAQWFRQDRAEAAQLDALADSHEEDPLVAYNQMLAELAERDRRAAASDDGSPGR